MSEALTFKQLEILCEAAMAVAQRAGKWIETVDRGCITQRLKKAGSSKASTLLTEVDIQSQTMIYEALLPFSKRFNLGFVGEENNHYPALTLSDRLEKPFFWCVDPLDGTLPFMEGRAGYAVSIALVNRAGTPLLGVVYDPTHNVTYHALRDAGGYRNLRPFKQHKGSPASLTVFADLSFKGHPFYLSAVEVLERCAQHLELSGVNFVVGNGAVKNACGVLETPYSCYLKLPRKEDGGGSIWDFAATACIAQEIGAWASDAHGRPLELNRQDSTFMNHKGVLFTSDGSVARFLVDALSV